MTKRERERLFLLLLFLLFFYFFIFSSKCYLFVFSLCAVGCWLLVDGYTWRLAAAEEVYYGGWMVATSDASSEFVGPLKTFCNLIAIFGISSSKWQGSPLCVWGVAFGTVRNNRAVGSKWETVAEKRVVFEVCFCLFPCPVNENSLFGSKSLISVWQLYPWIFRL